MSSQDLPRLTDDATASGTVVEMLHAARREAPSEEQLASLMSRLEGIEAATPAAAGLTLIKVTPVILVLVLVALGAFWMLGRDSHPPASPLLSQAAEAPSEPAEAVARAREDSIALQLERAPQQAEPTPAAGDASTVSKSAKPAPLRPIKKLVPAAAAMPSEPELVQAARSALQNQQWEPCMRLIRDHEQHYPGGILSEEREAIAVEALAGSGQLAGAAARLRAMAKSYPGSTYLAHLNRLMGENEP